jgi:hypothetical protein
MIQTERLKLRFVQATAGKLPSAFGNRRRNKRLSSNQCCYYVITLKGEYLDEQMKAGIRQLTESETLRLQRTDPKGKTREIDVRGFLKTIDFADNNIVIECKVSPSGTVRVDELLQLLHIEHRMLASPVKRTKVQWQWN